MEMWQKMVEDAELGGCSCSGTPLPGSGRNKMPLADPPAVKELIRAEVCMLLQTLRDRAGRNGEEHLSLYKPGTVSYALGHTNRSHNQEPEVNSRSVSRLSTQSNAEVEIEAVRENLNVDGIKQVVDRLRSLFTEECEALKEEIKQLQRSIQRKSQQKDCEPAEPTLGDLKELRDAIQKDLKRYPAPYTSCFKDLKSTHRTSHSAKSLNSSSPSKSHSPITTINETRKPTTSNSNLTSPSPRNSPISRRDSNSSLENHISRCATPADASITSQKNSPVRTAHDGNNKRTESNLSPQMERGWVKGQERTIRIFHHLRSLL
ncbi:hypothetical protein WMY93_021458 [Mugilogobius chulae]|uniref:Coiled-coil domain-containing protein 24 n=1 Tax=Mugilogobius chulae TaxID=88201 RepID=A0AAW0NN06_9GOBI